MSLNRNFSDALPLQMWKTGTNSFNKRKLYYTQQRKWKYEHRADVDLTIKFADQGTEDWRVQVLKDGVEVYNEAMDRILIEKKETIALEFSDPSFFLPINSDEHGWFSDNLNLTGQLLWEVPTGFDFARIVQNNTQAGSQYLTVKRFADPRGWPPGTYNIRLQGVNITKYAGTANPSLVVVRAFGSDDPSQAVAFPSGISCGVNFNSVISFTTTKYWKQIGFRADPEPDTPQGDKAFYDMNFRFDSAVIESGPTHDVDYGVYSLSFLPGAIEMANSCGVVKLLNALGEQWYSDSVYFPSESERLQIQYKAAKFAGGIPWQPGDTYMSLFVDAQFSENRDVTQAGSIQLTKGTMVLATSLSRQRRLELVEDGAPDYYLTKLNLVLQHSGAGQVLIDGIYWGYPEEGMERKERPENNPLHRGVIWLNEKDYYQLNQT